MVRDVKDLTNTLRNELLLPVANPNFKADDLKNIFIREDDTKYPYMPVLTKGKETERQNTCKKWLEIFLAGVSVPKTKVILECGGRADLVLQCDGETILVFEFKQKIRINKNRDQGVRYLISLLRSNPIMRKIVLIITDGFSCVPMVGVLSTQYRPEFVYERQPRIMFQWGISKDGEKVGIFNEDNLNFFWQLIHSKMISSKEEHFVLSQGKYMIESIIGVGASATVFKCSKDGEKFAVKIATEQDIFYEQQINKILSDADPGLVLPILDVLNSPGRYGLAYPLGNPIIKSNWNLESEVTKMTREQCYQLFLKILRMHQEDIVHRDIRPENIIVWRGVAYLIDLSFAINVDEESEFSGSIVTASQRILRCLGKSETMFGYSKNDDIGSFYKMAFRYFTPFALTSRCADRAVDSQRLYFMWAAKPGVGAVEGIDDYGKKCEFVKTLLFANMNLEAIFEAVRVNVVPPRTPKKARSPLAVIATHGTPDRKKKNFVICFILM